jgi:hypothetical protein
MANGLCSSAPWRAMRSAKTTYTTTRADLRLEVLVQVDHPPISEPETSSSPVMPRQKLDLKESGDH